MPLVSVIMPVYNGEKYLAEAIESILAQTFTDFELLTVDDGSQDKSAEIIQSYAARDSRIRTFQLERNMGQADASNRAIDAATGGFIIRMDCDDVSLPERLESQVNFLQSHPEIGGVGTHRRVVNHDLSSLLYAHTLSQQHALIALDWFVSPMFMGATLMLRREFLRAVGGYEAGRRATEDLELVSRLLDETSIRFANLSEVLYIHRRHEYVSDKSPGTVPYNADQELRKRILERVWEEAPNEAFERINLLRLGGKLSWAERRATKRDFHRLIKSLIAAKWVEASDRPLMLAAVDRRLEQASPRKWQQFCHWRRHHLQRN